MDTRSTAANLASYAIVTAVVATLTGLTTGLATHAWARRQLVLRPPASQPASVPTPTPATGSPGATPLAIAKIDVQPRGEPTELIASPPHAGVLIARLDTVPDYDRWRITWVDPYTGVRQTIGYTWGQPGGYADGVIYFRGIDHAVESLDIRTGEQAVLDLPLPVDPELGRGTVGDLLVVGRTLYLVHCPAAKPCGLYAYALSVGTLRPLLPTIADAAMTVTGNNDDRFTIAGYDGRAQAVLLARVTPSNQLGHGPANAELFSVPIANTPAKLTLVKTVSWDGTNCARADGAACADAYASYLEQTKGTFASPVLCTSVESVTVDRVNDFLTIQLTYEPWEVLRTRGSYVGCVHSPDVGAARR